jgi:hypothetical protein
MILRILLAGILGGAVLFGWGATAHMVLQFDSSLKMLPNEEPVMAAMRENVPESGIYFFPGADMSAPMTPEQEKAYNAKYRQGPSGLLIYHPSNEKDPMTPEQLGIQFGIDVILALLAAMLLGQAAPALKSYVLRLFFMLLIGLIAGIAVPLPYWNWYGFPSDFTQSAIAEQVIGFVLAGIVIAAIVRAKPQPAPAPAPAPTAGK